MLLLKKGSDEKLQQSQTKAISPPFLTHSLYVGRETEIEQRTWVHFTHLSHEMALLAFVTFLLQTTHGLETLRAFLPLEDAEGVDGVAVVDADADADAVVAVVVVDGVEGPGCEWTSPERRRCSCCCFCC